MYIHGHTVATKGMIYVLGQIWTLNFKALGKLLHEVDPMKIHLWAGTCAESSWADFSHGIWSSMADIKGKSRQE